MRCKTCDFDLDGDLCLKCSWISQANEESDYWTEREIYKQELAYDSRKGN